MNRINVIRKKYIQDIVFKTTRFLHGLFPFSMFSLLINKRRY